MKNILYIPCLAICLACSTTAPQKDKMEHLVPKLSFYKPDKLELKGDFDGNGTQDTLRELVYSSLRRMDMDSIPDPFQNDRDSVEAWLYDQNSEVQIIALEDTLHLGLAQGLYCLINMGDNNKDGKDEVAVVLDSLDHSKTNACTIYSLCKGKWRPLRRFTIHEDAFDAMNDEGLERYSYIKGYLEQRNGKWLYSDYLSGQGMDSVSKVIKWQALQLPACP